MFMLCLACIRSVVVCAIGYMPIAVTFVAVMMA